MLSQAYPIYPITVKIATKPQQISEIEDLDIEEDSYSLNIESVQECELSKEDEQKKLAIENTYNSISLDKEFRFALNGADDHQGIYRLYAFVNNASIAIEDKPWYEIGVCENKAIDVTARLVQDSETAESNKYFYIIAVPLHSVLDNTNGVNVLKCKSVPIL